MMSCWKGSVVVMNYSYFLFMRVPSERWLEYDSFYDWFWPMFRRINTKVSDEIAAEFHALIAGALPSEL